MQKCLRQTSLWQRCPKQKYQTQIWSSKIKEDKAKKKNHCRQKKELVKTEKRNQEKQNICV